MSYLIPVRLLLSAITVVCTVVLILNSLGLLPPSSPPFTTELNRQGEYVIRPRSALPIPAPFRDGDVLAIGDMRPADRAAILLPGQSVLSGTVVEVVVSRDGRLARGSVTITRGRPVLTPAAVLQGWIGGVMTALFLFLLAMLTLLRGKDRAAGGLAAFSVALLVANGVLRLAAWPPANLWLLQAQVAIVTMVALPALYVAAEKLAESGLPARMRAAARIAVAALALTGFVVSMVRDVGLVYYAVPPAPGLLSADNVSRVAQIALFFLPALILFVGYRRAGHESRLRIRWVLWSTLLCFGSVVAFVSVSAQRHPVWYLLALAGQGVALGGYSYAVLRTRLVDVSFVIDRALIFAVMTAVLVGCFSLLEHGLSELAVGEGVSSAVQALTTLLVAVVLNSVHRRLEHWIEHLFFRRQRLAVAALRRFVKECAFIERDERLLQIAVERLEPLCAAVAIYERIESGYRLRTSLGAAWPEVVDADDPLFISLRTHLQEVGLKDMGSAVGAEGLALPMSVANVTTGALICVPPAGEQFAPDVRMALAEVTRNMATSLYVLHYREQARLVADIAGNRIDEAVARTRAVALIEAGA